MKKYFKELITETAKANLDFLKDSAEGKQLLYLYALNHYYNGDYDYLMDVDENCNYDMTNGNMAFACFEPESYDGKIVDVLSTYYVGDNSFDFNKITSALGSIQTSIMAIKNKNYNLMANTGILKERIDPNEEETIVVRVITDYVPSYEEKASYATKIERFTPFADYIKFEVVFGDDLIEEIEQASSDKQYVDSGYINLTEPNNYCFYGEERSLITNVSAKSLKDNYEKYGKKGGLFAMNLRFYISDKKVDPGLINSIQNKGKNFWYYNNGIIIVCDDYEIADGRINLTNYSIVNGGQTTRMIGVTPFTEDFAVSCKIIKNKYANAEEKIKFVSEVAEASNTQKPINSADIIANKPEQRLIKENLKNVGIFVQVKRGDAAAANLKENYPAPWQKTKNDELGQIVYAGVYQKPGTARNSKDKIFSDRNKYEKVFGKYNESKYTNGLLKDLLILKAHYKRWSRDVARDEMADEVKKGLIKNGQFFVLSSVMLMFKFLYSTDLTEFIKTQGVTSEKGTQVISERTFNHRIFNDDYDALENRMDTLFDLVLNKYIRRAYTTLQELKPELVYSNFTKTDKNYISLVAGLIFDDFAGDEINGRVASALLPIAYQETDSDKALTSELVDEAINGEIVVEEDKVDELSEKLKESLSEYRSNEYRARGIKAYDIFTNKEMASLITMRPKSIQDLYDMQVFKTRARIKIKTYGEAIIAVIKNVCGD